jgi:hypothetical protein
MCFSTNAFVAANQGTFHSGGGITSVGISQCRIYTDGITSTFASSGPPGALTISGTIAVSLNRVIDADFTSVSVNDCLIGSRQFYRRTGVGTIADADNNYFWEVSSPHDYILEGNTNNTLAAYRAVYPALDINSVEASSAGGLSTSNMQSGNFANSTGVGPTVDAVEIPDWDTLATAWDAGFLGIDGTGP